MLYQGRIYQLYKWEANIQTTWFVCLIYGDAMKHNMMKTTWGVSTFFRTLLVFYSPSVKKYPNYIENKA